MPKQKKTNSYFVEIGAMRLPVIIRKHPTSRRLVLRYQPLRASVTLTIPRYATVKQGLRFIEEKSAWLSAEVMQFSHAPLQDGAVIPVLGQFYTLRHVGGRGLVTETEGELQVHGSQEFMPRRVTDFLKKKLRAEIQPLAERYAKQLGVKLGNITLRDTSSHWGSCAVGGNLSFSRRLIFAPREVLDYIVAHEVSHIREHNHSPAFWKVVESICPNYLQLRGWLKENGSELYKYG